MTPREERVPRHERGDSPITLVVSLAVTAICHAGPRFLRALVVRIVITSKCSIIIFVNVGLGSLYIPAASATTYPPNTRCSGTWIPLSRD